jgi:hypothetical protein
VNGATRETCSVCGLLLRCHEDSCPRCARQALAKRLEAHGFEHDDTGGNCTAYVRRRGDVEIMITVESTNDAPISDNHDVMVGEYRGDQMTHEWHGNLGDYLMVLDVVEARFGRAEGAVQR